MSKYLSVECIANKQFPTRLTVGKLYKVTKVTPNCYIVVDDKGGINWFGKNVFRVPIKV
jgi:CTP:phosphocholine cytidylyltransferase-like protein